MEKTVNVFGKKTFFNEGIRTDAYMGPSWQPRKLLVEQQADTPAQF